MAKKKVEPIIIKDEELMPTTLGEYSNKTKSPVVLFLIIILFATIAIIFPSVYNAKCGILYPLLSFVCFNMTLRRKC